MLRNLINLGVQAYVISFTGVDQAGKKIISSRMPCHPPLNIPIQNLHDIKKLAF